jgi:hypothetical protein
MGKKHMNNRITLLLLVFVFFFMGCEGANAPMGEPGEVALDPALIGTWMGMDEDDEEASILTISALTDNEYKLVYTDSGEEKSETMYLRGFVSSVDGVQFANISCSVCEEDENEEWYFFAFEFQTGDVLLAKALEDDVYKKGLKDLTEPAQIRAYIKMHQKDAEFFSDEIGRFLRKKD